MARRTDRSVAVLLLAFPFLFSGCVGIGFLGIETIEGYAAYDAPGHAEEDLLEWRGEPDQRVTLGSDEKQWTYWGDLCCGGTVLYLGLPIPLAVPVAREKRTYRIRRGIVVRASWVKQSETHYLCGLIMPFYLSNACARFGCVKLSG